MQCGHVAQIGKALQNYHDQHGTFPPAYTVDEDGNPLHSWRTLILPYFAPGAIEQRWKDMYDQIRFDEPWDSEHNVQINEHVSRIVTEGRAEYPPNNEGPYSFNNMPSVYGCPTSVDDEVSTVYKMIVGDNAIGNLCGTSRSQIKRPQKTILVIESGPPVLWMCHSDFAVEDFETAFYANEAFEIRREDVRKEDEELNITGTYRPKESALAQHQILGGKHSRQLYILFATGNVKIYWDWKLPLTEIEAMSRSREEP